jgi:hypothetical protein
MRELHRRYITSGLSMAVTRCSQIENDPFYNAPSKLLLGVAEVNLQSVLEIGDSGIVTIPIVNLAGKNKGWIAVRLVSKLLGGYRISPRNPTTMIIGDSDTSLHVEGKENFQKKPTQTAPIIAATKLQSFYRGCVERRLLSCTTFTSELWPEHSTKVRVELDGGASERSFLQFMMSTAKFLNVVCEWDGFLSRSMDIALID